MTTVESLAAEASPLLGVQMTIKSAEQLFSGDQQLLTTCPNVQPGVSVQPESVEGENTKKDKKKEKKVNEVKDVEKGGRQDDGLHAAINNAKATLRKALEDAGAELPNDALDDLRDEVGNLKQMCTDMKEEIGKLRNDFNNLLDYINHRSERLLLPSGTSALERVGQKVMILGDGNLSFSAAFAQKHPHSGVISTVLESEENFFAKYSLGKKYYELLQSYYPRVQVMFSIDACDLKCDWKGFFDDIIWNFPHHGGKTNLRNTRALLKRAFQSIGRILDDGRLHITVAKSQIGLDFTYDLNERYFCKTYSVPNHAKDSWQIVYLAADECLNIISADLFIPDIYMLYQPSGYRKSDRAFDCRHGLTLTFMKTLKPTSLQRLVLLEKQVERSYGLYHTLKPIYLRDISIVFHSMQEVKHFELELFKLIGDIGGKLIVNIAEVKGLRSKDPAGRPNRIYRLTWQCWRTALGRIGCNVVHEDLKTILKNHFESHEYPMTVT